MALYLVSYDIAEKDEFEYEALWDALKAMGAIKILYSEWAVVAGLGQATSIYNIVAPLTQGKDRLLVQEITQDARWDNLLVSDSVFNQLLSEARG